LTPLRPGSNIIRGAPMVNVFRKIVEFC